MGRHPYRLRRTRDLVASSKAAKTIYNALRAIHVHILQKQDNCTVQSVPFHIYFYIRERLNAYALNNSQA